MAMGASRPPNGREMRSPYSAEGHPARWAGGRFPFPCISPHLPPEFSFYSAKTRKKRKGGEEERRGSGEALFTRRFGGIFSF
jgi:hypothetical protein